VSNIIRFLETAGRRPIPAADYIACVSALELESFERQALLDRNHAALNELLGGRSKMFFGVMAPNEEPMREDDLPGEDEPTEPDEAEASLLRP